MSEDSTPTAPDGRDPPQRTEALPAAGEPEERAGRARYHHGNLREALLDATLDLIARNGVEGFSLSAAARAAGVSTAAPYRHFASKEALLAAVLERAFARLREQFQRAAEAHPQDPLRRLGSLGVAYVTFAINDPAAFRLLFRERSRDPGPVGPATFAVLVHCVEQAHRAGLLRDDLRTDDVVRASWSLVHGLATLHLDGALKAPGLAPLGPEAIEATVRVFIDGLRAH